MGQNGVISWRAAAFFALALVVLAGGLVLARCDAESSASPEPVQTEDTVSPFRAGFPNVRYRQHFSGRSWLAALTKRDKETGVPIFNVTFEPGCRNNWHAHTGGLVLVCVGGEGWYQARGEKAVKMMPGTVVEIPPNVEHWHGAGPTTWFSHLAIECHPETNKTTWREPVSDADYAEATKSERATR